jgi:tetrahydrodipicolinate N-succinyltransferase
MYIIKWQNLNTVQEGIIVQKGTIVQKGIIVQAGTGELNRGLNGLK